MTAAFGNTELPAEQREALRSAQRLQWAWLVVMACVVAAVAVVVGGSQAMKAAWAEDMLSLLPPVAFLLGAKVAVRRPNRRFPYGYHRSVGVGHLVAGIALAAVGLLLVVDSVTTLVKTEHPDIGVVDVFGKPVWLGWLMIGVMTVVSIPPVFFGRRKLKLARVLHDKVLHADAAMNKADWQTGLPGRPPTTARRCTRSSPRSTAPCWPDPGSTGSVRGCVTKGM